MSENTRANIGYFVAGFGALVLLITLFLLYSGTLTTTEGKGILMTLIVISSLLIGMGMYVVVPKEAHDAVNDFGGVARDIVPKFGLRSQQGQSPAPAVVEPAANQTTVVKPPEGPPIAVSPSGETRPVTDTEIDAASQQDPELATGVALPLVSGATLARTISRVRPPAKHQIAGAQRRRQDLYPPDEA